MSSRKSVALVLALAAAGLSAAHAASAGTWVGGEIGFVDQPVQSTKTREAVRDEFQAFRRNPVTTDGSGVWVGGERGYVSLPVQSTKTREAVRNEFQAFQRNPVTADGTSVWVGGERGYVNLPVRNTTTREAFGAGALAVRR